LLPDVVDLAVVDYSDDRMAEMMIALRAVPELDPDPGGLAK
jgi:hypothetical protein